MSIAEITGLIRNRRSIKPADMDPDREVDRSLLLQIIGNGTWAPTHGMTEPWRFHVFTGTARQQLAATLQSIYQEITTHAEQRPDKLAKLGKNPLLAPAVIACFVEKRGGDKIPFQEEIEAVACALQNIMLSATAAGLGSFWSSPPLLGSPEFSASLGQSANDRCIGLLYLGWPRTGYLAPRVARQTAEEKTVWYDDLN